MQLLVGLYATSVVTSAAFEGARRVASGRVDHTDAAAVAAAQRDAERAMRDLLGRYGDRVTFDWSASTPEAVSLRVRARNPRLLLGGLPGTLGVDEIDRTVTVRREQPR